MAAKRLAVEDPCGGAEVHSKGFEEGGGLSLEFRLHAEGQITFVSHNV